MPWFSIGAVTMNTINNTSITSIKGTTFISLMGLRFLRTMVSIVSPQPAREYLEIIAC